MSSLSKIVGLTGGIGCGKTTVLNEFRQLGVPCFVADEAGKLLYEEEEFCRLISYHFGPQVLGLNGKIDKKAIADIVFSDSQELQWLNAQVHPRVGERFRQWHSQQTFPYVIYESAILYEVGLDREVDCVLTVYLDKEERLRRLQKRDNTNREALEARMQNQISAEEKMQRANYVILNYEGNPRQRQVAYVHQCLMSDQVLNNDILIINN